MCASDRFFGYFQRDERGRDSFSVGRLGKSGGFFPGGAREMRKGEILERGGRRVETDAMDPPPDSARFLVVLKTLSSRTSSF